MIGNETFRKCVNIEDRVLSLSTSGEGISTSNNWQIKLDVQICGYELKTIANAEWEARVSNTVQSTNLSKQGRRMHTKVLVEYNELTFIQLAPGEVMLTVDAPKNSIAKTIPWCTKGALTSLENPLLNITKLSRKFIISRMRLETSPPSARVKITIAMYIRH